MNRSRFLTIFFIFFVLFLFLKIYQHNKVFSLMCEKQRTERLREKLEKKRSKLLVKLYQMKDQKLVCDRAQDEFGMEPFNASQVLTVTFFEPLPKETFDYAQRFTVLS